MGSKDIGLVGLEFLPSGHDQRACPRCPFQGNTLHIHNKERHQGYVKGGA